MCYAEDDSLPLPLPGLSSRNVLCQIQDMRAVSLTTGCFFALSGLSIKLCTERVRTPVHCIWWSMTASAGISGGQQVEQQNGRFRDDGSCAAVLVASANEKERSERKGQVGAVFFDMDDTLVLTHEADAAAHRAVQAAVAERVPELDTEALVRVFVEEFDRQAWDPEHRVDVTEWRARMWGKALAAQGYESMDFARELQDCFDTERMLAFRWAAGVESMMKALVAGGIKVGIITNGHFKVQRRKLEACKATQLFTTILVGGEEPLEKPHRDIFLKACAMAGCRPKESVMVGDNLKTDILGGINAGFLATVWVNVHKLAAIPAEGPEPSYVISTIGELPLVLRELGLDLDLPSFP